MSLVCHWCVIGVSLVCHWCVIGVSLVCHWCVIGVSLLYHWCAIGVSLVCHWCVIGVSLVCHWCVIVVSLVCHWCVIGVALVCHWCVMGVSWACHWCVIGVSFVCHWSDGPLVRKSVIGPTPSDKPLPWCVVIGRHPSILNLTELNLTVLPPKCVGNPGWHRIRKPVAYRVSCYTHSPHLNIPRSFQKLSILFLNIFTHYPGSLFYSFIVR